MRSRSKIRAVPAPRPRNEHAAALCLRAGHAGTAVAVNTRPKVFSPKGRQTRQALKVALRVRGELPSRAAA